MFLTKINITGKYIFVMSIIKYVKNDKNQINIVNDG